MQLAANLSWMYPDLDWAQRFEAAAGDGFVGVEILLPYDEPADWYAKKLRANGLELALLNTPISPGTGKLGLAAIPGAEDEFRQGFDRARAVAQATGCRRIHVMAGYVAGLDQAACTTVLLRNLGLALERAARDDLVLTLEALNRTDMPGYFYYLPAQAIEIARHFDSPHLRVQFDFFHCVRESLDLQREVRAAAPLIGHVQIAGAPGRHEPDLAQSGLLEAVAALPGLGYDSWIGCEYQPLATAAEGLGWCEPLRSRGVLR
jgi:hydroxypyruvate isomerase